MRRIHPSPVLAAAFAILVSWRGNAQADDELPFPRVVAQQQSAVEKSPPPREVKAGAGEEAAQLPAKEDPKAAKEEARAPAEAPKEKEEPKTSPLDEVKKALEELKSATAKDAAYAKTSGDSAWVLTASAFVMLMLPGLALFYGGMVRRKNVLATMMQSFAALAVVGLYWVAVGYGLAFGPSLFRIGDGGIVGWSWDLFFLRGVATDQILPGYNIPVYAHVMFQGMFAIITPALISGAIAERIRFWPFCIFMILWVTFVYCPLAHMVWAFDWFYTDPVIEAKGIGGTAIGLLGNMGTYGGAGALDFAGGTVVHIAAGMAGLACAFVLRKRIGYPDHAMHPNSMVLTLVGAGLLWFGWFGFNGGSATNSTGLSVSAFSATQAAAAAAGLSWIVVEWLVKGKPTALGLASGIVAGLVAVTPASGFVYVWGGVVIGLLAGVVCYFAVSLKSLFGYDDSLDAFGVHAVGGFLGAVLTGLFCYTAVNGAGADGYFAMSGQRSRIEELKKLIPEAKKEADALEAPAKEKADKVSQLEASKASEEDLKKPKEDAAAAEGKLSRRKENLAKLETELKSLEEKIEGQKKDEKGYLSQFFIQLKAASIAVVFAFVLSLVLAVVVQALTGGNFTTDEQSETDGLDRTEHGEVGFDYGPVLDTVPTTAAATPRPAKAPPGGERRFAVVIEGIENGALMKAWSDLCKPKEGPVDADFQAVYPYVTTVQGNKFRLRGGDPARVSAHLQSLFQKVLGAKQLKVRVEE